MTGLFITGGNCYFKQYSDMLAQRDPTALWKNHRIINKDTGLIVPQNRERLFENAQCVALLENILSIYQRKGELPAHYLHYNMNSSGQNETITYKGYVDYRCTNRDRKEGKQRVVGDFYILYRIVRLDKQNVNCQFPFLVLFDAKGGEVLCEECKNPHVHRITESSFYVTRTQFAYQLKNKLKFMQKYVKFQFTPQNFISNKSVGDTPYQHVRDHNYEPSYYFERCQRILVDSLKLEMLKRGIDCQSMRLDELEFEKELPFHNHTALFKLKYMCRKCEGKEIWTTRDKVSIRFSILPLEKYYDLMIEKLEKIKRKDVFDKQEPLKKEYEAKRHQKDKKAQKEQEQGQDKRNIQTIFKTERRRLDRSIKREVDEHEQFQKDFEHINRWHSTLEAYSHPFLVLYSIKVPKMPCKRCLKQKDGLIYITNLVDETHSALNRKVINTMLNLSKKTDKS